MANILEIKNSSPLNLSSGASPLTTNGSGNFLPTQLLTTQQSGLNAPLMQNTTVRASAAPAQVIPDPGNTRSTAFNIGALDTTTKTFSDAVSLTDRNDYYQFSVSTQSNLNLTLTGLTNNANVQLVSATGTILKQSAQAGTTNEAIAHTLAPGTYYVRVFTATGTTNYNLNLSAQPFTRPNPTPTPTPTPNPNDFVQRVLELTNQFRTQNSLAPLRLNIELNAASLAHSKDMALQDYFNHTGKNGSAPWDRARLVGYEARTMGENIAAGYTTPDAVVQGWINSPGHRANLLNASFTEMGLGYFYLPNDTGSVNYNAYWTQLFGSGDTNPTTTIPA